MKASRTHCVVWVTVPNRPTARRIAKAVLNERLAACVSIVPGVESHYWWKGAIDTGRELLLVMKTVRRLLPALEQRVLAEHPYETPEFVVAALTHGSARYLEWIDASVAPPASTRSPRNRGA